MDSSNHGGVPGSPRLRPSVASSKATPTFARGMCGGAKQSTTEVEHPVDIHDFLPASTVRVGASQELGPLSAPPQSISAEHSDPSLRTSTMIADANYWIFQGQLENPSP